MVASGERRAKKVAVVQSCYIPWKGYFDLINSVDEFILYDDAQYTKRDWRNRNLIKTSTGPQWLSIPVEVKGRYHQKIKDTKISDPAWGEHHWKSLLTSYGKAPFFAKFKPVFEALYRRTSPQFLSEVNRDFLVEMNKILGITTPLTWSMDYAFEGDSPTARLLDLCQKAKATHYLSGPSAKDYFDVQMFAQGGVDVSFYDYSGYAAYKQLFPPFDHHVTALDLIFNEGDEAFRFLKSTTPMPLAAGG